MVEGILALAAGRLVSLSLSLVHATPGNFNMCVFFDVFLSYWKQVAP